MGDFNDLENDIAGNWLSIQKRIQDEERREEELNNPKRLHCTYKEFYKIIYQALYEPSEHGKDIALHEMFRMVLSSNEEVPKGFEKIWNVFCDIYKHTISEIECMSCGEKYDILYERVKQPISYEFGEYITDTITIRYEPIYCPKCSRVIGKLEKGTFISLTTSIHGNMEERSNDIRYEF